MSAGDQTPSNLPPGIWQDLLRHTYALIDEITKHGINRRELIFRLFIGKTRAEFFI